MDWYFDFVSPYSYLQCEKLAAMKVDVHPKPLVFAGLLKHWGHKGPAEMPSKRTFIYRQVVWLAARNGVPLTFPPRHPFNPIKALRLNVALDSRFEVTQAIYRYIWRGGGEVDTDEGFARLCGTLGVSNGEELVSSQAVKDRLIANGEEAIAAGVFGVPTLAIDGQLFWGYDATEMALDYQRDPGKFLTDEIRRVDELPVGASRR